MYRFILILFVSFSLFVLSGCNESAPTDTLEHNSSTLLKNNGANGAQFFEYQGIIYEGWTDKKNDLVIVVGIDNIYELVCGSGSDFSTWNFKDKNLPNAIEGESPRVISKASGDDIAVAVWNGWTGDSFPPQSQWCDFFAADPIATGNVKVDYNDNDAKAYDRSGNNHNTYKFKVKGNVTDSEGNVMTIDAFYHANWDGDDNTTLKDITKIQLR